MLGQLCELLAEELPVGPVLGWLGVLVLVEVVAVDEFVVPAALAIAAPPPTAAPARVSVASSRGILRRIGFTSFLSPVWDMAPESAHAVGEV